MVGCTSVASLALGVRVPYCLMSDTLREIVSCICQEVLAVSGGSKPGPLIHLVQNWESRISIFCWISLKSLLVIQAVMYILRPYESRAVGRQLRSAPWE